MFMALTKAAARTGGEAVVSHTVLVANGPLTQSGYWNPTTPLAVRVHASAHLKSEGGFMAVRFLPCGGDRKSNGENVKTFHFIYTESRTSPCATDG